MKERFVGVVVVRGQAAGNVAVTLTVTVSQCREEAKQGYCGGEVKGALSLSPPFCAIRFTFFQTGSSTYEVTDGCTDRQMTQNYSKNDERRK